MKIAQVKLSEQKTIKLKVNSYQIINLMFQVKLHF